MPASLSRRRFFTKTALATGAAAVVPGLLQGQQSATPPAAVAAPPAPPVPEITKLIARWVLATKPADVPAKVRAEAVRSVVNWIGVAVGGSHHETVDCAVAALGPFSGSGQANLFGRGERFDALKAAFLNGVASHVLDFDDTHLRTIIHPAGPVVPALLGLAQHQAVTGRDFLHAFILGGEVECRLGNAIYPSHYEMGWHITGTAGVFGAAVAAGRLLGLDEKQMAWALGLAASEAGGLKIQFGTMTKSFHPGRAAENGLLAALLAARGFTSSEQAIEGKEGYVYAASREHNYDEITRGLGEHWEIATNTYKPFACGIVIHPIIDGMIQFRQEGLQPADVESIAVRGNPLVQKLTGKKTPQTGLEGKFSVFHSAAIALIRGYAGTKEYTDEVVRDPQVVALRDRVSLTTDPAVREDETYLTVKTQDGRTLERHVEHIGSLAKPMTNDDLEFKCRQLADDILPKPQTDELLKLAWDVENLPDVAILPRAAATGGAGNLAGGR